MTLRLADLELNETPVVMLTMVQAYSPMSEKRALVRTRSPLEMYLRDVSEIGSPA